MGTLLRVALSIINIKTRWRHDAASAQPIFDIIVSKPFLPKTDMIYLQNNLLYALGAGNTKINTKVVGE